MIGTRNVPQTLARAEPDRMGNLPFKTWQQQNQKVKLGIVAGFLLTFPPIFEAFE